MDKKFCPFINAQCREDCAYYERGEDCGLKRLITDLITGLTQV